MLALALAVLVVPGVSFAQIAPGPVQPVSLLGQGVSFNVSSALVPSNGTATFTWNVPASVVPQPLALVITPCPAGVSMFDITNNKTFVCGDVGRTIPASGSDVIRFTNTNAKSVQLNPVISNIGASQVLVFEAPIIVAPGAVLTPTSTPTFSITSDINEPAPMEVPMGDSSDLFGIYDFKNTNSQNIKITGVMVFDKTSASKPTFASAKLFSSAGTLLGAASSPVSAVGGYTYTFNFATPVVLGVGQTLPLALRGDVDSYVSGGAVDGSVHQFSVVAATGIGQTSNQIATANISNANGEMVTVVRAILEGNATQLGGSNHTPSVNDALGTVNLIAPYGSILMGKMTVTFSEKASTPTAAFLNSATLIDPNGLDLVAAGKAAKSVNVAAGTVTWNFNNYAIAGGTTVPLKLVVNSTNEFVGGGGVWAGIENQADLTYTDATDGKGVSGLITTDIGFPLIISQANYSGGVSGNGSELKVAENTSYGNQAVTPGTTNVKIGSYSFSASPIEAVNVSTVMIKLAPNAAATPAAFQNLKVLVNGTQFGATQSVTGNNGVYAFSGPAISVPAGSTVVVDTYADFLSSASGAYAPATAVAGYTATGATSYSAIDSTSTVNGQTVTAASTPAITVSIDSSDPMASTIVQNTTGDALAVFRVTQTSNTENIKITHLNIVEAVASTNSVKSNFVNVGVWNGSTLLGTAAAPVADAAGTGYLYSVNLTNPIVISTGGSVSLFIRGDAGSYANGSLTDGSNGTFEIVTTTDPTNNTPALAVTALGMTSNAAATVTLSNAHGNPMTVARTTLALSATPVSNVGASGLQQLGSVTLTANSAGDAVPNNLKLTFTGSALNVSTTAAFMPTVVLRDQSGIDIVGGDGFAKASVSGNTISWAFTPSTRPLVVTAGASYTMTVWGNVSDFPSVANIAQTLTATISASADFGYLDGTNSTALLFNLPPGQAPVIVANLHSLPGGPLTNAVDSNAQTAIMIQSLQSLVNALMQKVAGL